jgi:hypothetical protein
MREKRRKGLLRSYKGLATVGVAVGILSANPRNTRLGGGGTCRHQL